MSFENLPVILDETKLATFSKQIQQFLNSKFLPDHIKTFAQAFTIAQKGLEIGVTPMQAFAQIYVIKGKPAIQAELMLALIYKNVPGSTIDFVELTDTMCAIEAVRAGGKINKFSFSIEDAKKAGLTGNQTWSKYPRAMLRSRCVSEMARSLFPDAIMGCSYTPEELGVDDVKPNDNSRSEPTSPARTVKEAAPEPENVEPDPPKEKLKNYAPSIEDFPKEAFPNVDIYQNEDPCLENFPSFETQQAEPINAVDRMKEAVKDKTYLGDFECKFGKFKGKQLKQIEEVELRGYMKWCQDNSDGKKNQMLDEFLTKSREYLNS